MMSMGTEVSANAPHPFRNAYNNGFFNLLPPRLREKVRPVSKRRGGDKKENVHRFWIESGVFEYKTEELNEGETLKYTLGSCQMQVKTHLMKHNSEGELVDDSEDDDESDEDDEEDVAERKKSPKPKKKRISAETEFANDFTECYDDVGHYFPILLRLRELVKLVCIYGILKSIYDNLETAKKELNESISSRTSKAFKAMRKHITYPQNNFSNVNEIYRRMLYDQGIKESNLASGEEGRAKRTIRKKLDEADAKMVVDVAESLASSLQISNSSEFRTKVRKWLSDGLFTSYTKDLVRYIVEQIYPREYEKLDRFAKNAASNGICFGRENDDDMNDADDFTLTGDDDECPWVPAAFCHEEWRRVYGGVCILPQLRSVKNFNGTYRTGNSSFMRNPAGRPAAAGGSSGGSNSGGGDDGSGKKGHGNWRGSSRPQHVYEIRKHNPGGNVYVDSKRDARQHPTLVYKVGVSKDVVYQKNREGMPERVGNSMRAQRQTDALNKRYVEKQVKNAENRGVSQGEISRLREHYRQNPVYTCHIVERIPGGQGARGNVLDAERNRINSTLENQGSVFGVNTVPGNQEPATSTYKQQLFPGKTLPDKNKSTVNYKKGEN